MIETCANCGVDVDKDPIALCDDCEGNRDAERGDLERALAEVTAKLQKAIADGVAALVVADVLKAQLAASQAREARLRAALKTARAQPCWRDGTEGARIIDAAIATKPDDSALREFGLRVAREAMRAYHTDRPIESAVDAVLRGGER
jgi:hypothetical protein